MVMYDNPNLVQLELTAKKLEPLLDQLVFLGGATIALFITQLVPDVRSTLDVDCIVEVISLIKYYELLDLLKERGFKVPGPEKESTTCRLECEGLLLDVVPTKKEILGFGNRWYEMALKNSIDYQFSTDLKIRHVSATYFMATKLEAFKDRGNKDYFASSDFEDIITIIDGRPELFNEVYSCDKVVQEYISDQFGTFLQDINFRMALPGHLPYGPIREAREKIVLKCIEKIALLR